MRKWIKKNIVDVKILRSLYNFYIENVLNLFEAAEKYGSIYWLKPHDCALVQRYAFERKVYMAGQVGANKTIASKLSFVKDCPLHI